jgi:hypothetical protein
MRVTIHDESDDITWQWSLSLFSATSWDFFSQKKHVLCLISSDIQDAQRNPNFKFVYFFKFKQTNLFLIINGFGDLI